MLFRSTIRVTLSDKANGKVVADAIRLKKVQEQVPVAEIAVEGLGQNIGDGDTTPSVDDGTDFGTVLQGDPTPTRTFTVRNTGTANLTVDTPTLTLPNGYTIIEALSETIPPGGSDTFTVQLATGTVGTFAGDISFTNNDADGGDGVESPFKIGRAHV